MPPLDSNEIEEQPGTTTDETSTESSTAPAASAGAAAGVPHWGISGSVGRWEKGAVNTKADIETVQEMLRLATTILHEPRVDPGDIDGQIARNSSESATVKAIEAFQGRFLKAPDGVIDVGGRTWRELVGVLESGKPSETSATQPRSETSATQPQGTAGFFFPFDRLPSVNWTDSPRRFASSRSGGRRAHAGCDLYFPIGTIIHAITDGKVVRGPYAFYAETYAIEIDHGTFIARYGEVQGSAFVSVGDHVTAGQPIAKVGHLVGISVPSAMLHLELYNKSAQGPLTVSADSSATTSDGRPFFRRRDIIDPTPKLNEWKNNLPGS